MGLIGFTPRRRAARSTPSAAIFSPLQFTTCAAYLANALANSALYRTMFDAAAELENPTAADRTFEVLVGCVARARDAGRFSETCDPQAVATQFWVTGHGLTMLVLTGVLPPEALDAHAPAIAIALFVAAGDDEDGCRRSVRRGWSCPELSAVTAWRLR